MDRALLAWGLRGSARTWWPTRPHPQPQPARRSYNAVAAGNSGEAQAAQACPPRLWLFTDAVRLPDPRVAVARLPRGRAGVVLRHDSDPRRAALARDLALICRERRLILVVAGDVRLAAALGAGVHLRGGRWPASPRLGTFVTSSAHTVTEVRRAARAGANLVFLSPAFPTASHADAPGLGALRWARLAMEAKGSVRLAALGGVDGRSVKRLPARLCQAVGAIGALS